MFRPFGATGPGPLLNTGPAHRIGQARSRPLRRLRRRAPQPLDDAEGEHYDKTKSKELEQPLRRRTPRRLSIAERAKPVARPPAKELTERELEVMHVFWKRGESTVAEARD